MRIVRVTVSGRPSCVSVAVVEASFADGEQRTFTVSFDGGVIYETFVADVSALNRWLATRGRRRRRS